MTDTPAIVRRFQAATTAHTLAELLLYSSLEEQDKLREYLGNTRFHNYRQLARRLPKSTRGPAAAARENVVVLHGIMGSELSLFNADGSPDLLWLNLLAMGTGGLDKLKLDKSGRGPFVPGGPDVRPTNIMTKYYGGLIMGLSRTANVRPFWYDWRKSLDASAASLEGFIREQFGNQPVKLVAHSMGGLVARTLMLSGPTVSKASKQPLVTQLIMLGTPNYGSFEIPLIFAGIQESARRLIRIIGGFKGLFDLSVGRRVLNEVVGSFPGLYQMLPWVDAPSLQANRQYRDLYTPQKYQSFNTALSAVHMTAAGEHHEALAGAVDPERMVYIAGEQQPTVVGIHDFSRLDDDASYTISFAGDGRVPHALGLLPKVNTYYVKCAHGDLPNNKAVLDAVVALLSNHKPSLPDRAGTARNLEPDSKAHEKWVKRMRLGEVDAELEFHIRRVRRAVAARESTGQWVSQQGGSPPADDDFTSPALSAVEDLVVDPFLGQLGAADAGDDEVTSSPAALEVHVVCKGIEDTSGVESTTGDPVDAIAVGVYANTAPAGATRYLDEAISRVDEEGDDSHSDSTNADSSSGNPPLLIGDLMERGIVRGDLAVPFFLPDPRPVTSKKLSQPPLIALVGMGTPGHFGTPELRRTARELCWSLGRLGKRHLATLPIGAGTGNLPVGDAAQAFLQGVAQAVKTKPAAESPASGNGHDASQATAPSDASVAPIACITFIENSPARVIDLQEAVDRASKELQSRLAIKFTALYSEQELVQRQAEVDREKLRQKIERLDRGQPSSSRPKRPAMPKGTPTRIVCRKAADGFSISALTETAAVPERISVIDPGLVAEVNDSLVVAPTHADQTDAGLLLGHALIAAELRADLLGSKPLVVEVDANTAKIHWEMLIPDQLDGVSRQNPTDIPFLGLQRGLTRQLRTQFARVPSATRRQNPVLRVLIVADPARDAHLPGAQREAEEVGRLFEDFQACYKGRIVVNRLIGPAEATRPRVLQNLMFNSIDLLHYCGHCFFNAADPPGSGWLFGRNAVLSARELDVVERVPRFVFSNACESGITPDRPDTRNRDFIPSFAESFFRAGVEELIATGWSVDDLAARQFAVALYGALLGFRITFAGDEMRADEYVGPQPMSAALAMARHAIFETPGGRQTWGAYQHYGNPHFMLIDPRLVDREKASAFYKRPGSEAPPTDAPADDRAGSTAPKPKTRNRDSKKNGKPRGGKGNIRVS